MHDPEPGARSPEPGARSPEPGAQDPIGRRSDPSTSPEDPVTITGMLPALLTAYDDAGQVSTERTTSLVSALNEAGVDGYFVTGTSGEYYLLSAAAQVVLARGAGDEEIGRAHV